MVKRQVLKNKIKIGDRWVGPGEPCFIIAEAGVNHNGDIKMAKKLIDAAVKAGADAIKFQTFLAEDVVTAGAPKARYQKKSTGAGETQLEMIKKLELGEADFKKLRDYARRKSIIFLSTPFDEGSVNLLEKLGVPAFKIGSGEITNFPLIKYIARKGKPVILSTGMSYLAEVKEAVEALQNEGTGEIVLLHCVSCYPAKIEDTNLRAMETLRRTFKQPAGLSDHSPGITIPAAAAALGACVIEKHFTLDRTLPGPDHQASLEPEEFTTMVRGIRDIEKAMGSGRKQLTALEKDIKKAARRSIVAAWDIAAGTIISEAMLAIKRPGTGLAPKYISTIVGKKAKVDIRHDELITSRKLS